MQDEQQHFDIAAQAISVGRRRADRAAAAAGVPAPASRASAAGTTGDRQGRRRRRRVGSPTSYGDSGRPRARSGKLAEAYVYLEARATSPAPAATPGAGDQAKGQAVLPSVAVVRSARGSRSPTRTP